MRKFSKIFLMCTFCAMIITTFSSCTSSKTIAVEEGWDLLGEQKVNFVRDRDQIKVYNQTFYSAVKFQVLNKDVHLNEVNIVYPNGDKLNPQVDEDISAGAFSKEIQIDPLGKEIRSIEFSYRSRGNLLKGRARVLVFGKRSAFRSQ